MATRLYFHSAGSPAISPNPDAGWEQTGQLVRRPMSRKSVLATAPSALADSSSITIPITTTQQILCNQFISDEIFSPVRLNTDVLFSMVIRTIESATTANAFLAAILRAIAADGVAAGTSLGTLFSSMTNAGTEYATGTAATRIFSQTAISAVQLNSPFRLCLEVGAHAQAPSAATSYIHRMGCSAASDFALTSALTTDLNPWMELSQNLNASVLNNYQGVKVGNGMSTGERIR